MRWTSGVDKWLNERKEMSGVDELSGRINKWSG